MKRAILLSAILMTAGSIASHATIWTISNSGNLFSPATATIALGDTVRFNITSSHDAVEVSEATYAANGTTPLAGGFEVPFGGGTVLPAQLPAGQHWFVCTPHASMGMKGIITVTGTTSITDILAKAEITVGPNPTSNYITLQSSLKLDNTAYSVVDIAGKKLAEGTVQGNESKIDIQTLPKGNYFLLLGNGMAKRTIKVVKL